MSSNGKPTGENTDYPDDLQPLTRHDEELLIAGKFSATRDPGMLSVLDNPDFLIAEAERRGHSLSVAEVLLSQMLAEQRGPKLEVYRESRTLQLSAGGAGTLTFVTRLGYKTEIYHVAVSVTGASGAATAAVYVSSGDDASEEQLADFASALLGSSPARNVAHYALPIELLPDERLLVKIAGAVASSTASVRIAGRRHPTE
jgi:hypothetical protein